MNALFASGAHVHLALAVGIFLASYVVFAIGRFPGTKIDRPAAAVIGAALMFAFRVISPGEGILSIDYATIILLFSMMLIVSSLHFAGFFDWITDLIVRYVPTSHLLPGVIFTSGILSAFLVNDVVCLVMAPLILKLCKQCSRQPTPYLLALATASNIGSVATITGNPQNILIGSISGIHYGDFLSSLMPIALAGLFVDWLVLHWLYSKRLLFDFFHHWKPAVRAGSDHEALTFPGYPFLDGQRRMTELPAESLGGFFLAFVDFAAINYDIVLIGAAVDLDGAESEFVEMHTRTP